MTVLYFFSILGYLIDKHFPVVVAKQTFKKVFHSPKCDDSLKYGLGSQACGFLCLADCGLHEGRVIPDAVYVSHIAEHKLQDLLGMKTKSHSWVFTHSVH